jgi:hypothetical protein
MISIKKTLMSFLSVFLFQFLIFGQIEAKKVGTDQFVGKPDSVHKAEIIYKRLSRKRIIGKLKTRIENSQALTIHTFVPLCDNKYQGIIKVPAKLGDGRNLKTNLYWGAGYGLKAYYTRSKEWKYIRSYYNLDTCVLERAIYYRTYSNHAKVYLILDAYKGDKMDECVFNYFKSLAGILKDSIVIDSLKIPAYGNSNFLIFNGHNGLMDNQCHEIENVDQVERDAAVISCCSYSYFIPYFEKLKAYPLITTTNYLPPEAYIISAIIDNWATMQADDKIRTSAGEAMAKVHKIAVKPCINTFKTGW